MLVAAAVCPCPPLLVPDVAAGAAPELNTLREACADAVGLLAASRPDRLVVVGPVDGAGVSTFPPGARGGFASFGVPLDVRLGPVPGAGDDTGATAGGERPLPPSLAVAGWLLRGWNAGEATGLAVGESLEAERCAAEGRAAALSAGRVALLVMGDGSACRTVKAPGYLDDRAEGFDAVVSGALAAADTTALADLDAVLAAELRVAGRAPWQVLAGAAAGAGLRGELLYEAAPYGVGYFVACWT
ncbi:class III extradiol dioxygenase subunit B-like domain-containing protein [Streptomyces sp. NPDC020983]|uniref:class III extradiol dioxygenase subunit B-like domain-containing protein n=1 Tax=Streptomyces sp. NPDC020983 TaxID=3365106 RepID=UPI0037A72A29